MILLTVFQLYLAFLVGYLLLLVAASWKAARSTVPLLEGAYRRFLILVPAHNEERLLPDLLASLARLDYPPALFQVHVVVYNCTDQTITVARHGSTQVHVRNNREHLGKRCALNWLLCRATGKVNQVATVNVDFVVQEQLDPELRYLLQHADLLTADGMPRYLIVKTAEHSGCVRKQELFLNQQVLHAEHNRSLDILTWRDNDA